MDKETKEAVGAFLMIFGGLLILWLVFFGWPKYQIWRAEQEGKATLAKASQIKQIMIETARGELEASKLRAKAIEIVGKAAKEYPEYRAQEYLLSLGEALELGKIEQIIYLPTEAGIPITEAGRRYATPSMEKSND